MDEISIVKERVFVSNANNRGSNGDKERCSGALYGTVKVVVARVKVTSKSKGSQAAQGARPASA
jgi:hypothetical protein